MILVNAIRCPKDAENKTWASFHVTSPDFEHYWFNIMEDGNIYCRGFIVDESTLLTAMQNK
jgi:hypothetical protein